MQYKNRLLSKSIHDTGTEAVVLHHRTEYSWFASAQVLQSCELR